MQKSLKLKLTLLTSAACLMGLFQNCAKNPQALLAGSEPSLKIHYVLTDSNEGPTAPGALTLLLGKSVLNANTVCAGSCPDTYSANLESACRQYFSGIYQQGFDESTGNTQGVFLKLGLDGTEPSICTASQLEVEAALVKKLTTKATVEYNSDKSELLLKWDDGHWMKFDVQYPID